MAVREPKHRSVRLDKFGIRTKIMVLVCVLTALTTAAVGLSTYLRFNTALVEEELKELNTTSRVASARFAILLESLRDDVSFLARTPPIQGIIRARQAGGVDPLDESTEQLWRERLAAIFREVLQAKHEYIQIRYVGFAQHGREIVRVDRNGGTIRIIEGGQLQSASKEPCFGEAVRYEPGTVYLSDFEIREPLGSPLEAVIPALCAATPVRGPAGERFGLVVIHEDMRPHLDALRATAAKGHTVYVTNDRGEILMPPDDAQTGGPKFATRPRLQDLFPSFTRAFESNANRGSAVVLTDADGHRIALGIDKLAFDPERPERFLGFVTAASYDEVVAGSVATGKRSLTVGMLLLALAAANGLWFARSFTRPLRRITDAVVAFGRGASDVKLPLEAKDEAGVLARAFDDMIRQVRERTEALHAAERSLRERAEQDRDVAFVELERKNEELKRRTADLAEQRADALKMMKVAEEAQRTAEEAEQRFRRVVESAPDAMVIFDARGKIVQTNPQNETLFCYSQSDLLGKPVTLLMAHRCRSALRKRVKRVLAGARVRAMGFGLELYGLRRDGSKFPVEVSLSPLPTGEGPLVCASIRNITERKRAAIALHRQARELSRSNEQLQQFAAIASHDLQEPLRKVRMFAGRLRTKCEEGLNNDGRDYLARMQNSVERMQALIDGLLTFSRVTTKAQPFTLVELGRVTREVLADLDARIEESGASVCVEQLPTIEADPLQMRQLLQNLIGNALKFSRPEESPMIQITSRVEDGSCQIVVEDNGIGFDEKYVERVFAPFQRLHSRGRYEGTGMGLAICRSIIERHGGSITAKSTPGQGSAFIVTLPVKQMKGATANEYQSKTHHHSHGR